LTATGSTEVRHDIVFVGIQNRIYRYDPTSADKPRQVATRPALITSLAMRWGSVHENIPPILWDSCFDGNVRRNLTDQVEFSFEMPILGVLDLERYLDHYQERVPEPLRLAMQHSPDKLLYLIHQRGSSFCFRTPQGLAIGPFSFDEYPPHAYVGHGGIYWTRLERVQFGVGYDRTVVHLNRAQVKIVPFCDDFLVFHTGPEVSHPEGCILSTRDKRTICTWDYHRFGHVRSIGTYRLGDAFHLFFTTRVYDPDLRSTSREADEYHLYTMPLRPEPGTVAKPELLDVVAVEDQAPPRDMVTEHGINPFLAQPSTFVERAGL
jgi:hypothetical protein